MLLARIQSPLGNKGHFKTTTSSWWQMGELRKEWLLDWQFPGTLRRWWMAVAMAILPNTDLSRWLNIIYGLHSVRNSNSIKSEDKNSNFQSSLHLCPVWGYCLVSIRENCYCSPSLGKIPVAFNQANILLKPYSFCYFKGVIEDAYNKELTWNKQFE